MTGSSPTSLTSFLKASTCLSAAAILAVMLASAPARAGDDKAAAKAPGLEMEYHAKSTDAAGDDDPLESVNRVTSGFNSMLRSLILDPLVNAYKAVTPDDVQRSVSSAASNLSEPATAVSSLLQGDMTNAGNATKRFLINSTVGIGGIGDPAGNAGIHSRKEDLGQAMGANGVNAGPHLVLPLLGPSNLRDATGTVLTSLANPLPLVGSAAEGAVSYSDNKDAFEAATAESVDPYTTEKTLYEQHRQFEVSNGKDVVPADGPTLADEAPSLASKPR